ncbi:MAG: serine hydrolase domain-containing protein [Labedaea sp.]
MSDGARVDGVVGGWCDPAFGAVRTAFAENFASRGEVGAAVCVVVDGVVVADLVGGWADAARSRPWRPDTLVNFYSVGKALVALLALQLVDRGLIGLDTPIASVWPQFGHGGKETVTLRMALCHQAGVPAIRARLTNEDLWSWDRMTDALAGTEPWWPPGSRHAYHTNTFGHLIGEVVRRVSGEPPGERLRAVAAPLGADVWFGVPAARQHRCAEVIWAPAGSPIAVDLDTVDLSGEALMNALAHFNPPGYSSVGVVNTARWRSAQLPSTNGHGTARGLATLYAALLRPGELVSPGLLDHAARVHSSGPCPILGADVVFGLGFTPTSPRRPLGPNPRSFGHFGTGGALGFADPDAGVAFGYVMNHVVPRWRSSRNQALIAAIYESW